MSQLAWQRSSFSEPGSDTCVEIATAPADSRPRLRESATPATVIATTPAALHALLGGIKGGALICRAAR
ncbi:DUF397 domain-containing protein [Streptomyces europaeiscabiei]|uniref:DUF397 domain-containing protein n=1 Tax=Streptomyces europaeiscabiei TaxID=146819 RepID=UPI002E0F4098|nr:DUF397 domain-containing protein [Streptomyces europaeiscabiei]